MAGIAGRMAGIAGRMAGIAGRMAGYPSTSEVQQMLDIFGNIGNIQEIGQKLHEFTTALDTRVQAIEKAVTADLKSELAEIRMGLAEVRAHLGITPYEKLADPVGPVGSIAQEEAYHDGNTGE